MTHLHPVKALTGSIVLASALLVTTMPAQALRVPLVTNECSVASFGAGNSSGLTYNSSSGLFALTDDSDDVVYVFDGGCNVHSTFSASDVGSTAPQGIAYDSVNDRYAIVDNSADEVFFTDASGAFVGQCDLQAVGSTDPRGIGYAEGLDTFAINDASADEVLIIDDDELGGGPCNVLNVFDAAAFGSTSGQAITYVDGPNQYAQLDGADEVFIVDQAFLLQDQYDTINGFGSGSGEGIAYVSATQSYYFVDSSTDLFTEVDANGTSEFWCSTVAVGSTSPVDVVFVSGEIAVVDDGTDTVYVLNAATCGLVRLFNISILGIANPAGMTYIPETDQLAITDTTDDEVYFVGYTSTALEGQCDTAGVGLRVVTGIDFIGGLDLLVMTDSAVNSTAVTDLDCNPINQNSLRTLGAGAIDALASQAVGYQGGLGRFLIVDNSDDQVYLNDYEGLLETQFDLRGLNLGDVTGIAALPGGVTYLLSVNDLDAVFRLDVPGLNEAASLSGRYVSAGLGVSIILYERGEGRITGSVLLPATTLPVFGQFDASSGSISFGVETPAGAPVVLPGNVSADLNTIALPPPLGVLTRTF